MANLPPMTSYYDETLALSLEMPEDWAIGTHEEFIFAVVAPVEEGFQANLSFSRRVVDSSTPDALKRIIQQNKEDQHQDFDGFVQIEEKEHWLDGNPAYTQQYQWQYDDVKLSQMLTLIMTPDRGLIEIHGVSLRQLEQKYMPVYLHIINSIRFIPIK